MGDKAGTNKYNVTQGTNQQSFPMRQYVEDGDISEKEHIVDTQAEEVWITEEDRPPTPIEYKDTVEALWPLPTVHGLTRAYSHMALYNKVKAHNVPNFMGARIPVLSNLNCDNWDLALEGYSDSVITQYIRYGWPLSYTAKTLPRPTNKNHSSAAQFATDIDKFLKKEIGHDAMLGPFDEAPFDKWCHCSPLLTRPKKESKERRVIIDLSYPRGHSVNDGIVKNFYMGEPMAFTLPSVLDMASLVARLGSNTYLWKCDLARAYRQMRLDPLAYPLMGIRHKGKWFVDICPPFGCRMSGGSQQRISNAVCYLMAEKGHTVMAYVDDFGGAAATLQETEAAFKDFNELCAQLGLALAPEKSVAPATQMEWLGFRIDTNKMVVTVPRVKLSEVLEEAGRWMKKSRATRRELQSLAGKLSHISHCIVHSRKFMSRILATLRRAPKYGTTYIDEQLRKDIIWFLEFGRSFNGRYLITPSLPTYEIQCDACLGGGGGFSPTGFYDCVFPKKISEEHHISRLEAVNVVIALKTLIPPGMTATRVIVITDNSATAHVLTSGRTRDPVMAACAREAAMVAATRQLTIDVQHAPGETLELADALSRRAKSKDKDSLAARLTREKKLKRQKPVSLRNLIDLSLSYRHIPVEAV